MSITASPLAWPEGWARCAPDLRESGHFGTRRGASRDFEPITIAQAVKRVVEAFRLMGITGDDLIVSTNLKLKVDGLPRSDQRAPADPGAAVYWKDPRDLSAKCMAVDQYETVQDNLAAIAATLEAMRAIARHGGSKVLERAFTGFVALPAPTTGREWWVVLGVDRSASFSDARKAYKKLVPLCHPDSAAGSHEKMVELNAAWLAAQKMSFSDQRR